MENIGNSYRVAFISVGFSRTEKRRKAEEETAKRESRAGKGRDLWFKSDPAGRYGNS